MPDWNFDRSIESMRLQAMLATEYGMHLDAVLLGTGVSESMLMTPSTTVKAHQELRLIQNIVAGLPDTPSLGLEAGKRYHFTIFGMLGFAMVSSRTLREALALGLQYFKLTFAFTQFHVEDSAQHTTVLISAHDIPDELERYIIERDSACFMTLQKDLCEISPQMKELSFRYSQPQYLDQYKKIFGITPTFMADKNKAVFDREVLENPMLQYNALACEAAKNHCQKLLNQTRHHSVFTTEVRGLIATNISNTPSMEDVAKSLHMTPRTLHRKLKANDSSFVKLRDEVRKSLADEYLFDLKLSIEQISYRLGYADGTTFINAYKRWHGITPHARRRQ